MWVKNWDANSMLWRYFASRNFDASKPFGGDMMKALAQIKAPVLLLPSMTDRTIPGYLTRELYRGLRGNVTYAEIPSDTGTFGRRRAAGDSGICLCQRQDPGVLGWIGEIGGDVASK